MSLHKKKKFFILSSFFTLALMVAGFGGGGYCLAETIAEDGSSNGGYVGVILLITIAAVALCIILATTLVSFIRKFKLLQTKTELFNQQNNQALTAINQNTEYNDMKKNSISSIDDVQKIINESVFFLKKVSEKAASTKETEALPKDEKQEEALAPQTEQVETLVPEAEPKESLVQKTEPTETLAPEIEQVETLAPETEQTETISQTEEQTEPADGVEIVEEKKVLPSSLRLIEEQSIDSLIEEVKANYAPITDVDALEQIEKEGANDTNSAVFSVLTLVRIITLDIEGKSEIIDAESLCKRGYLAKKAKYLYIKASGELSGVPQDLGLKIDCFCITLQALVQLLRLGCEVSAKLVVYGLNDENAGGIL